MSDRFSRLLANYTVTIDREQLPAETIHEVKRRILDTLGVALAAGSGAAPQAASAYAATFATSSGALLWGTRIRVPPEMAAFANGVQVRYLDFNDTYLSLEPLHPSDLIPALWALAEWKRLSGPALLTAVAIAYEIAVTLCDAASLRRHGWDHVNYIGIGAACGAGKLLGLEASQIEQAIAITTVAHAAMRQTRVGELSMWKGAAAADAARHGIFAALLARHGFTGPSSPFNGEMGFFRQVLQGESFAPGPLRPLEEMTPPRRILDTHIKYWPVEYHAQSAVDAALQLRSQLSDPARLASVHIETFQAAYEIIAKDPEKWAPRTRETADHSLPYIVLAALLDGEVTPATFLPHRIQDPHLRHLLTRETTLVEN
ncbi:MAG: MmgE/PrpD family protein, partial [Nitrospinota bacterium]